jgi:hypothetical protein
MRFARYAVCLVPLALSGMRLSPVSSSPLALEPTTARGTCERCKSCMGDWEKMHTVLDPIGITEGQPCVADMCRGSGGCVVEEQEEQPSAEPLEGEAVAHLWNAMLRKDPAELTMLIRRYPEHVTLNVERESVQLRSCVAGYVIANVPLPRAVVMAIQAKRGGDFANGY